MLNFILTTKQISANLNVEQNNILWIVTDNAGKTNIEKIYPYFFPVGFFYTDFSQHLSEICSYNTIHNNIKV